MPVEERFFRRVRVLGPDDCWMWMGCYTDVGRGFGMFYYKGGKYAHRFAYELVNGPIPDGLKVLHTCEVTLCVNPSHLYLGTHQEAIKRRDLNHGPYQRAYNQGEKHPRAILKDADIPVIRALRDGGKTNGEIAKMYGVSPLTISAIYNRHNWSHVA